MYQLIDLQRHTTVVSCTSLQTYRGAQCVSCTSLQIYNQLPRFLAPAYRSTEAHNCGLLYQLTHLQRHTTCLQYQLTDLYQHTINQSINHPLITLNDVCAMTLLVRHMCDVRPVRNPSHLSAKIHFQNNWRKQTNGKHANPG